MVNTNLMFSVNMQPVKGIWNCGVMGMGEEKNQQLGFSNLATQAIAAGYMQAKQFATVRE